VPFYAAQQQVTLDMRSFLAKNVFTACLIVSISIVWVVHTALVQSKKGKTIMAKGRTRRFICFEV
jgi:hypothetical protein